MYKFFEKLINPYPEDVITTPPKNFLAFIWQCTDGTRFYLALLTFGAMLIAIFEALLFAFLGRIVDWLTVVQPSRLWQDEGRSLLLLAVVICSSIFLVAFQSIIKHQTLAGNFPMRLRWNFHRLMLNQSMDFFQNEFSGRIAAKIMQTALSVREVCFVMLDVVVFVIIYFVTMTGIVGGFSHWLLVPFFTWLLLYAIALYFFIPKLSGTARRQADARSLMTGRITDAYTNISTIKLFSHAGRESDYVRSAMHEFMGTVHKQMRLVSNIEIINHALSMLLILGTAGIALLLWTQNIVGTGAIAAATAMTLRLQGMAQWIMWTLAGLFENIGTVQDGINTLTRPTTINDEPNAKVLHVTQGEIRFNHVNFIYDKTNKAQAVIDDLNLTIKPGEKIGLVGRSGAGKSTLINLLLRFYDINSGQILIDGQNIAHVTQDSLREKIGMVTQDTSLLHRTIRENILYGKPDASEEEMKTAAKYAEAHDFIQQLTDSHEHTGYDVYVGERGVKLSGGQRQRISIARVMLKNSPILLLDEATSALDSEVESVIQESLYRLMEGKTVVAIAHRLSTIAAMDRLIVLEQGKIVEEGNHKTLLEKNGVYAQLWKHQTGGFIGD